jgi:hypothetical protein
MKFFVVVLFAVSGAVAAAQQPAAQSAVQPADALAKLSFMQGDWAGKQNFNTNGGPAMLGDATDKVAMGIAGKYLCETLSTTLPGRKPTDTRHFVSFDKQSGKYTAWWFNDTSYHPTLLTGDLTGNLTCSACHLRKPNPRQTHFPVGDEERRQLDHSLCDHISEECRRCETVRFRTMQEGIRTWA